MPTMYMFYITILLLILALVYPYEISFFLGAVYILYKLSIMYSITECPIISLAFTIYLCTTMS